MRADTQPCQPTLGFPQGETAIDQHVGVVARDQCAIPSATASQNRETHLTEVVLNDTQYAASDVSRRDGVDVLLDSNLHVVTHLHQTDLITLGTGFDLFLGWRTAKQATEEARLVFRLARLLRQVDVVQAGAAVDVLDAPVTLVQRTTNAGPCTVQVVTHVEHRVAAAVFGQGYAAGGVVVTGCNQGYRTALGCAAAHAGQHVVSQLGVQAQVGGTRREIDVSRATGRTPDADDIDFTVLRCTPGSMRTRTRVSASAATPLAVRRLATDAESSSRRCQVVLNSPVCGRSTATRKPLSWKYW